MIQSTQVQQYIAEGLPCTHLHVEGDGHHWDAVIVSADFAGKSRVQRQQRVYAVVGQRMATNEIHALSMKCYTPEEWAAQQG